jgi:adhesin transport system outer membrane protein
MIKKIFLFVLLLTVSSISAQAEERIAPSTPSILTLQQFSLAPNTLKNIIAETVVWHPEIQTEINRSQAVQNSIAEKQSSFFPRADIELRTGSENVDNSLTRSRNLRNDTEHRSDISGIVSQRLINFGEANNGTNAAKFSYEAALEQVQEKKQRVALEGVSAATNILRTRAQLVIALDNYEQHQRLHQIILSRAQADGQVSDVYQSEVRLSLARTYLVRSLTAFATAIGNFEQRTGIKVAFPQEILFFEEDEQKSLAAIRVAIKEEQDFANDIASGMNLTVPTLEELRHQAVRHNRSVRALDKTADAFGAQSEGLYSKLLPVVDLEVRGTRTFNGSGVDGVDQVGSVMMVFRYNLTDGGADSARVRAERLRTMAARSEAMDQRRQITDTLQEVALSFYRRQSSLIDRQNRSNNAVKVAEVYQEQFKLGRRSLLDLLDVQNEQFVASSELIDETFGLFFDYFQIQALTGNLLSVYGVGETEAAVQEHYQNVSLPPLWSHLFNTKGEDKPAVPMTIAAIQQKESPTSKP